MNAPAPLTVNYRPRNKSAYDAGKRARTAGQIHAEAQLTYEALVKACRADTFTTITEAQLAEERGLTRRTIQEHLRLLRVAELVRVVAQGNLRRKYIVAFGHPADEQPEIASPDPDELLAAALAARQAGDNQRAAILSYQAAMQMAGKTIQRTIQRTIPTAIPDDLGEHPDIDFFSPPQDDPRIVKNTIFGSSSTINRDLEDPIEAGSPPTPRQRGRRRHPHFFGREESPETPAVQLLRSHGVRGREQLRQLAERPLSEVQAAVDVLKSRYARWGPGLLVHVLVYGLWNVKADAPEPQGDDPKRFLRGYCPECNEYTWGTCQHTARDDPDPPSSNGTACPICHQLFTVCMGVHGWAASPLGREPCLDG